MGADDYICKPFSPREMVARIKAVLRRQSTDSTSKNFGVSQLRLNPLNFRVFIGNHGLELTTIEFQLLQTMYMQPGRIFSRTKLMDKIYPDHRIVSDRTIDSHIKKLRKKLAELMPNQELIHSVYGAGYCYVPCTKCVIVNQSISGYS